MSEKDSVMTEREDEVVERFAFNSCEEAAWADDIGKLQASAEGDYVRYSDCVKTITALKAKCEKAERDFQVELEMRKHSEALLAETQKERDKALDSYLAAEATCVELERLLSALVWDCENEIGDPHTLRQARAALKEQG